MDTIRFTNPVTSTKEWSSSKDSVYFLLFAFQFHSRIYRLRPRPTAIHLICLSARPQWTLSFCRYSVANSNTVPDPPPLHRLLIAHHPPELFTRQSVRANISIRFVGGWSSAKYKQDDAVGGSETWNAEL